MFLVFMIVCVRTLTKDGSIVSIKKQLTIGRSSMYNRKIIGPKIDPCGTPYSIPKKDGVVLFIDTN